MLGDKVIKSLMLGLSLLVGLSVATQSVADDYETVTLTWLNTVATNKAKAVVELIHPQEVEDYYALMLSVAEVADRRGKFRTFARGPYQFTSLGELKMLGAKAAVERVYGTILPQLKRAIAGKNVTYQYLGLVTENEDKLWVVYQGLIKFKHEPAVLTELLPLRKTESGLAVAISDEVIVPLKALKAHLSP